MNCEPILLQPPDKRQYFPPATTDRSVKAGHSASPLLVGSRRETRTVLVRPGDFTVSLEPFPRVLHRTEIGYTISIWNTGREPLCDLEIAETLVCAPLPSEAMVFRADTPPILPGERRMIPRLKICPPGRILIITTVMARSPHAGSVHRSCHLELEGRRA